MSVIQVGRRPGSGPADLEPIGTTRRADMTTLVATFVVLQFALPSTLVVARLPMALSAGSLIALGLGVLWWCTQLTTTLGAAKGSNPVRTALFLYACVVLASYGKASFTYLPDDERASGDSSVIKVFAMIFLALAVCDGIRNRQRLYFLLRVIVVGAAWVAFVGVVQYVFLFDPTEHMRLPGMQFNERYPLVLIRGGLPRVSGTTGHPIEFGVFCAMALPLAVHIAFAGGRTPWRTRFWWGCVGVIATGLMFSASRSAILAATTVGLVLFVGWSGRRRIWMVASALGFLVFIKLVSPGLLGALFGLFRNAGNDDSVRYRTHDYATAREAISANPWLGRGIGTWYSPKRVVFDNQYLLTLVESGFIGLLALLGLVFAALRCARKVGLMTPGPRDAAGAAPTDRDLALSLGASLTAVLPAFATFDFRAFATVDALMFLLIGVAGAHLRVVRDGTPPHDTPDIWRTVGVLLRRWYVAVPTLLVGLLLTGAAYSVVPPRYESTSFLTLTTPVSGGTETPLGEDTEATAAGTRGYLTNPLANFDRTLNLTAAILIQELNTAHVAEDLVSAVGGGASYEVGNGSATPQVLAPGPFIFVRGTGSTPEAAAGITDAVSRVAKQVLTQRQRDLRAPTSTRIELRLVSSATEPTRMDTGPLRVAAAGAAVAIMASLTAAYGFESWSTSRRRRRRDTPTQGPARPIPDEESSRRMVPAGRGT